jgi:hypothetical protein
VFYVSNIRKEKPSTQGVVIQISNFYKCMYWQFFITLFGMFIHIVKGRFFNCDVMCYIGRECLRKMKVNVMFRRVKVISYEFPINVIR